MLAVLQGAGLVFVNMAVGGLKRMADLHQQANISCSLPVTWWGPAAAMAVWQATAFTLFTVSIGERC